MKLVLQIISILYWLLFLKDCDSYFVPYLLIGICGSIACYRNSRENKKNSINQRACIVFGASLLLAFMTISANFEYLKLIVADEKLYTVIAGCLSVIMIFGGGFFAFWSIFVVLTDMLQDFCWKEVQYRWPCTVVFLISFSIISIINIFVLVSGYYPGLISGDSLTSIEQGLYGYYTNHHPFYYTVLVKIIIDIGLKWFGDMNAAVMLYSVIQIFFMAACFSYVIVTFYQMGISIKIIIGCWLWYIAMPYHILYSFTMWKDIVFSGFAVIFTVSVFRILKNMESNAYVDQTLLVVGSVGICLFRNNGWIAFLMIFFCFLFLFGENQSRKKIWHIFLGVLIITFILNNPVLQYLKVEQPNAITYLSVPVQQVSRVVKECDDIREEHKELLNEIVDIEQIPSTYNKLSSEPVKMLVVEKGNQNYLIEHKLEFFVMYLELGMSHLDTYIEAWIDLTKGYWNGGYSYWRWLGGVDDNQLGIRRSIYSEDINNVIQAYISMYADSPVLQIFLCIGFHVWLTLIMMVICIIRRDKVGLFLMIPVICILASLLISTPVYSEFRYAYAVFCNIPFLLIAPFYKRTITEGKNQGTE